MGLSGLIRGHLHTGLPRQAQKSIASFNKAKDMIWRHDLFADSMAAAGLTGLETGTKLYISNLDYGVSNEDIKELFSEIGELKRCAVHYDRNGRPSGSAEVMFRRRSDAMAALKRYNNVQLDGKAMKIEMVGTNLGVPVTPRINVVGGANGRGRRTVVMTPEFGRGGTGSFNRTAGERWDRGGFQHGRGRGRGWTRGRGGRGGWGGRGRGKKPVEKSADDLNKDLETYHAKAMNTS
ncbi:THO complex subunit 4D-like isoform X1 [Iris pallida]|uniref:THO complex subunit 4D-like isoform X1 n=1 Tax=Iris pallida TaxID=29817 RepID=A0AAX6FUV0_IRIPA|nr:THO complex subunit 4D-like isoform X1 [Iris pallida]